MFVDTELRYLSMMVTKGEFLLHFLSRCLVFFHYLGWATLGSYGPNWGWLDYQKYFQFFFKLFGRRNL